MSSIQLISPDITFKDKLIEYRSEFLKSDHIAGSGGLGLIDDYEEWLSKAEQALGTPEPGFVKSSQYLAVRKTDKRIVGVIQLRHSLNDYLKKFGGHIGYSVRPTERRKGYASEMLLLSLRKAKSIGLEQVLLTCDSDNIASEKVILSAGGVYKDSIDEENGSSKKRFWIQTDMC